MPEDQSNILDKEGNPVKCENKGGHYTSECLLCHSKVIIHCNTCGVQISGCSCTLRARARREMNQG